MSSSELRMEILRLVAPYRRRIRECIARLEASEEAGEEPGEDDDDDLYFFRFLESKFPKRETRGRQCFACRGTGTTYYTDGVYGPCLHGCLPGDDSGDSDGSEGSDGSDDSDLD